MAARKRKSPKGKFYSEARVREILRASRRGGGPRAVFWQVDIESLVSSALRLACRGERVMRFFVTEDVPGHSPGNALDSSKNLLFIQTVKGFTENYPPVLGP